MIEYFLHVDLLVPEASQAKFEELAAKFLAGAGPGREAFKRLDPNFDNELVFSLKTAKRFPYTGGRKLNLDKFSKVDHRVQKEAVDVVNYINLWRVPDLHDLDIASMMLRCADDTLYADLNSLVIREIQNYVIRVRWLSPPLEKAPKGQVYQVHRQFSPGDLGRYLGAVGVVFPLMEQQGFRPIGYFQNVTGPLNTVLEYWEQLDGAKHDTLPEAFDAALKHVEPLRSSFNRERMRVELPLIPSAISPPPK